MKMHTLRHGPRIKLVTNTKKSNKKEEVNTMCQKLESYKMPPVIMGIENKAEAAVEKWYRDHRQVRNVVLEFAKRNPTGKVAKLARSLDLNSYPETYPAPPVLLSKSEEEEK